LIYVPNGDNPGKIPEWIWYRHFAWVFGSMIGAYWDLTGSNNPVQFTPSLSPLLIFKERERERAGGRESARVGGVRLSLVDDLEIEKNVLTFAGIEDVERQCVAQQSQQTDEVRDDAVGVKFEYSDD